MPDNLTRVKECIASCERAKKQNLEYYNIYWRDQHEVLLRVEKDLEEYKEMLDEQTTEHYKQAEELTKTGLNFYDALATLREKENK
jgi:hypothetical protein